MKHKNSVNSGKTDENRVPRQFPFWTACLCRRFQPARMRIMKRPAIYGTQSQL